MKFFKYIFLLIFISLICQYNNASTYHREISWLKNKTEIVEGKEIQYFNFENAFYYDYNTPLPHYYELLRVNDQFGKFNVILEEKVFETIDNFNNIDVSHLKKIPNNITIEANVKVERTIPYLEISFIPIRKNSNTGKFERLVSFNIKIEKLNSSNRASWLKSANTFTSNSVLSSGKWVHIKIEKTGVYSITYQELKDMGFGNPNNVKLFGNGGKMLPLWNSIACIDDLMENAIYFEKGSDGVFNEGDYILFYAQGPVIWNYDSNKKLFYHTLHNFTDEISYFLTDGNGQGKIITKINSSKKPVSHNVSSYSDYVYHEKNDTNLIKSGRQWYGEVFNYNTTHEFNFPFSDRIVTDSIIVYLNVVARSSYESYYSFYINNQKIGADTIPNVSSLISQTGEYAVDSRGVYYTKSNSKDVNLKISYNKPLPSSSGYLDFVDINVRSNLVMQGEQMAFRDIKSVGANNVSKFTLKNSTSNIKVWDVSDIFNVKEINADFSNSSTSFSIETDTLKEFIVFNNINYLKPEIIGEIENQNLHKTESIDFLIITHPDFYDQADELAKYHTEKDNFKCKVVDQYKIFNEFSSGNPDVAALRNYIKMIYDREKDPSKKLKYLLLFGDGSYNNKSNEASNTNFILTYQSFNSLIFTQSYVTDDFYGLLDNDEGEATGLMDIGIGRFPVSNINEAQNMVNKVKNYCRDDNLGDWQNVLCFVGDDGDGKDGVTHMNDANKLSEYVNDNYKNYNSKKIFLDAYQQVTLSIGQRYPDVNKAISDRMNKGVLIFNYAGHGGEIGLAHESIITVSDINSWDNENRLPIFVTATCQFSRFDDLERTSAGEKVLLNSKGGGIALLTTTRVTYSGSNYSLNKSFYNFVFEKDTLTNDYYRLGDIIRLTKKNTSGSITNKRNFSLLGDPAIMLKYPKYDITTDSVNHSHINDFKDTLKAFSKVNIAGHVINENGILQKDFEGIIYPTIYDKRKSITTFGNDGERPFNFEDQSSIIYKGKATVKEGRFSFTFIVPKDISYEYGYGKISYYAHNNSISASGYFDTIYVGGTSDYILNDSVGPEIKIYLNDENFVSGGITNEDPILFVDLIDSSGINTVGNAIGHDITAVVDSNTQNVYVLNDFYESNVDQYQKGKIEYKFSDLKSGNHNLKLKVWDILNNSSSSSIDFIVSESAQLAINRIFNYPNPFTQNTSFYFEHNQPFQDLDVLIQIFTVSGKLVKTIETNINSTGFLVGPITWDGFDDFGDKIGRGVYIYRVKLRSNGQEIVEKFEKLVILK